MWLFPIHFQMLYDMHMYVYICLYMKMHTQWWACMLVMPVMHIYRYIIKIHFIPIFSKKKKSMMFYALCTYLVLILLLNSQYTGRRGWRQSLPQVPFPSILHWTTLRTAAIFWWCLTVAAMVVVHIRLQWNHNSFHLGWSRSLKATCTKYFTLTRMSRL